MNMTYSYSYRPFKDYILEIFKNEWDTQLGYVIHRILQLFRSRPLSIKKCTEILDAEFESEGGIARETIDEHFRTLKKYSIIQRCGPPLSGRI